MNYPVFLGVTTVARTGWEKVFAPVKATRTKVAASQAAEVAEKTAERQAQAAVTPYLATVTEAVILGSDGQLVDTFQADPARPGLLSQRLLRRLGLFAGGCPDTRGGVLPSIFCRNARDCIRILVADAAYDIARHGTIPMDPASESKLTGVSLPLAFWTRSSLVQTPWVDPQDLYVNTDLRHDMGYAELCRFLNIDITDGYPPSSDVTAQAQAQRTFILAKAGGLV